MSSVLNTAYGPTQRFSRSSNTSPVGEHTPRSAPHFDPVIRKRKYEYIDNASMQLVPDLRTPIKPNQLDLLITPPGNSYYKRAKTAPSSPTYLGTPRTPQHLNFAPASNLSTPPTSSKNSPEMQTVRLHMPTVSSSYQMQNGSSNFFGDTCYSFNLSSSSMNKSVESNIRASHWRDACQEKIKHEQNKQFKQFQQQSQKFKESLAERYKPQKLNPPKLFQPSLFPKFNNIHSFIDGQYQKYNSIVDYPFSYNDNFNKAQHDRDLETLKHYPPMEPMRQMPLLSSNNQMVSLPPVGEIMKVVGMDKSVVHPLGLINAELDTYNDLSQYSVSLNGNSKNYYQNQLPRRMDLEPLANMHSFQEPEREPEPEDEDVEPSTEDVPLLFSPANYRRRSSNLYQTQPVITQQHYTLPQETPQEPRLPKRRKSSSSASGKITKKSSASSRKSSFNSNRGRVNVRSTSRPRTRSSSRDRMTVDQLSTSSPTQRVHRNSNDSTSTIFTDIHRSPTVTSEDLTGTQTKTIEDEERHHGHSHSHNQSAKKCLSCGSSNSPCWRPSWDPLQGQLCNSCGLRYRKTKARCMNNACLRIPAKSEWALILRRGKGHFTVNGADLECYKCLQCDHAMEMK